MASLTPEQRKVASKVLRVGRKKGAERSELIAAMMTGLVESNMTNIKGGDRDSSGWRQERAMYYPNPNNVGAAANRFFTEIRATRGKKMTPGQKAQATQRSAFPERYDQRRSQAIAILKELSDNASPLVPGRKDGRAPGRQRLKVQGGTQPKLIPGRTSVDYDSAIVDALLSGTDKGESLLDKIVGASSNPAYLRTTDPKLIPGKAPKYKLERQGPGETARVAGGKGGKDGLFNVEKDNWKGSRSVGRKLAALVDLPISSEKRSTVSTASGNVSDHYLGNKDSYAWDMSTSGAEGTRKAAAIARRLGVKNWNGGSWLNVTKTVDGRKYRFQVGWNIEGHYDHIHMGIDRLDTPG